MVDPKLKHAHLRFPHSTVQCVQVPILALGARVGTFLPVHVPQVWGAGGGMGRGGGGDEAIGATQTSNSEHQSILYGIRVPNSMPP